MMMDSGMLKKVCLTILILSNQPICKAGEEETNTATKLAEDKFFEALKAQKDERLKIGKPLIFNDDEWSSLNVVSNHMSSGKIF